MKRHKKIIFWSCLTLLLSACADRENAGVGDRGQGLEYAVHFSLEETPNWTLLRVFDPWQNSRGIRYDCVLGRDPSLLPDSLKALPFIRTPVTRVLTMSTTHLAHIGVLGELESIVGLSGAAFVYDSVLREGIAAGRVKDVGYGQGLNYEAIVELDPDVLFMYGVDGGVTSGVAKLEELGIPVVYCADYLELDPLGKAEWIRFFAAFYDRGHEAAGIMDSISIRYRELAEVAQGAGTRPKVLTGLPWKDSWYIAGGRSFAARLINDAGGNYLWSDNNSEEALPHDLETVYSRAVEADIWINPGAAGSLGEIRDYDQRFAGLPVMQAGRVYNNDLRMSPGGGNDYWESGTLRPDLVLADLIAVFHPELARQHEFTYYRKLK